MRNYTIVAYFQPIYRFFTQKQSFKKYLSLVCSFYFIGIVLAFIVPYLTTKYNLPVDKSDLLVTIYNNYVYTQIPILSNSFLQIFSNNLTVALTMLFIPTTIFFIVLKFFEFISIDDEYQNKVKFGCVIFVLLLTLANSFQSFAKNDMFLFFNVMPFNTFLVTFLHGLLEIPIFILCLTSSLFLFDQISSLNFVDEERHDIKIKLSKIVKHAFFLILLCSVILFIAAYIECYITPQLIKQSMESYFLSNSISIPLF